MTEDEIKSELAAIAGKLETVTEVDDALRLLERRDELRRLREAVVAAQRGAAARQRQGEQQRVAVDAWRRRCERYERQLGERPDDRGTRAALDAARAEVERLEAGGDVRGMPFE